MRSIERDRIRSLLVRVGSAALLGAASALLLVGLIPAVHSEVGPAVLTGRVEIGLGGTNLLVPPLGSVQAETHDGPLSLDVSLQAVDISDLADRLESGRSTLTSEIETDLASLARSLAVRTILGGAVIGGVILALLPRRSARAIVSGSGGGALAISVVIWITATGYSVDAFQEPRFTGALTRAPVVIDALREGDISIPQVRSRFETAADRLTRLMALLAEPNSDPRDDSVAILHISDVHSNPIGLQIAKQLAKRFEVDAVLDTGDLTNFGVSLETRIADLVDDFDVPYLFVPGNHDSDRVVDALSVQENVRVLDGTVTEVEGVSILGFRDPTYTNWDLLPPNEAAEVRLQEAAKVALRVDDAEPDILAIHDKRIADLSSGLVPLIISGHYHERQTEQEGGTLLLGVGTTGASGFKSFTLEADMAYEAQILYLRGGRLIAYDYITFTGLGSDFVIERSVAPELGPLEPPESLRQGSPSPSTSQ